MGFVEGMIFYVGKENLRPHAPANDLRLDDDGALCQVFRNALLQSQRHFKVGLTIQQYPKMECEWIACGQTAGLAAWLKGNSLEAVTAYLNGLDAKEETMTVELALVQKQLPIPLHMWHEVLKARRPICATFLLTASAFDNRVLATGVPALGNSFFSIMGTV